MNTDASTPAATEAVGAARERVRARYAATAVQARAGQTPSCAESDPAGGCGDAYNAAQLAEAPTAGAAS